MLSESSVSLSVTVTVRVMLEPSPSSPLYSPMTTSIASPSSCCNWRIVRCKKSSNLLNELDAFQYPIGTIR
ncbi:hypothetical protein L211DRAFT_405295 [Terfezia boudieri ATCC MYA-4762]|uniref:Uncharacterized protein n=1 Tax=Terfezia boudieri ATCC MYA-4762 TaxID=1051890 RepID=A0A3N4M825_9PEZI|nr:hypothetical protein L211DRAFT_405295 [Terfezia boudieri ATCC MYA-4762]